MSKKIIKTLSLVIGIVIFATAITIKVPVNAASSQSQLQNDISKLQQQAKEIQAEINRLKKEASNQAAILAAIQKQISNTQAQIQRCNQEINNINNQISANNQEIEAKREEISQKKFEFNKRIRAIYMSQYDSNLKILLGADNFSDFLQLSKMTESIAAHDKAMIDDINAEIEELNQIKAKNEELLASQVEVKNSVLAQQKNLESQEAEAKALYNKINADKSSEEANKAAVDKAIKDKQAELDRYAQSGSASNSFINSKSGFMWPVPYTRNITSGYGYRWGTLHKGIDISAGGIYGKPVVAITDGVIESTYNACPHKSVTPDCRCGSGWGNHVKIDHGIINGTWFRGVYAHFDYVAPGITAGTRVKQGQVIGYVGTTGWSTGYHLHFSLLKGSTYVDPYPYFFG